jgi:hypothetical protein
MIPGLFVRTEQNKFSIFRSLSALVHPPPNTYIELYYWVIISVNRKPLNTSEDSNLKIPSNTKKVKYDMSVF